jgi:hypothetical protein
VGHIAQHPSSLGTAPFEQAIREQRYLAIEVTVEEADSRWRSPAFSRFVDRLSNNSRRSRDRRGVRDRFIGSTARRRFGLGEQPGLKVFDQRTDLGRETAEHAFQVPPHFLARECGLGRLAREPVLGGRGRSSWSDAALGGGLLGIAAHGARFYALLNERVL